MKGRQTRILSLIRAAKLMYLLDVSNNRRTCMFHILNAGSYDQICYNALRVDRLAWYPHNSLTHSSIISFWLVLDDFFTSFLKNFLGLRCNKRELTVRDKMETAYLIRQRFMVATLFKKYPVPFTKGIISRNQAATIRVTPRNASFASKFKLKHGTNRIK
uniref:Uncharacterized protein n=1 Tax=Glossina pallidipes TaxID=7398 RepID=A0A1B0A9L2_GLOPL